MDETRLLQSRLDDLIDASREESYAYLGFLNEKEASFASGYLKNLHLCFNLYGGYENATRVFVCVCSDDYTAFDVTLYPIKALMIESSGFKKLSHRDYLGSLMGLGIKRECIGDILSVDEHRAVAFVRDEICYYVISQLEAVGREKVKVYEYSGSTDKLCTKHEELTFIVTSMRIDNIVSSLCKVSRSEAVSLIESDKVFVNYSIPSKVSCCVSFGDTVSIRGYGKFKLVMQTNTTKRDRLVIKVLHYI
ncbi:MAG: YlmH/Sll1252 family protein [Eubacteriales bacterium]|nr:YlmH/Sll1252 family protein [Eubacteriales bacterium]